MGRHQLSQIMPLGQPQLPITTIRATSTVLSGQGVGATLLSVAASARWDQLSRTLQLLRVKTALHNPWTSMWSQEATRTGTSVHMFFSDYMSQRHQHRPLLLHGYRPRHVLSSSMGWDFTMVPGGRLATHKQAIPSTLTS